MWTERGKQPIRPEGNGKGIIVSDLITVRSRLIAPWMIPDKQPQELSLLHHYATQYPEYSKDNYWVSVSMIDHATPIVLSSFQTAFPGCITAFAFNNN